MSNFLAVAAVTATLKRTLDEVVAATAPGAVANASVTVARPEQVGNGPQQTPGINVFLYQVSPNPAWRNADLPGRGGDGQLMQRTMAAVDLHYLLTFHGDEAKLEPQRLMGVAVRTLHERPVVTRAAIKDAVTREVAQDPSTWMQHSDLADQIELVRFSPLPLTLEELSKLWSVFFQTPYALSVAYQGSVVLIDGTAVPQPALPVRDRGVYVVPFRNPAVEQVMANEGPAAPILASSTLVVLGRRLQGDVTLARVGGADVTPTEVTDSRISFALSLVPAATLRAGVTGVQIVQQVEMGTPPVPHRGFESNIGPFVLRPTISSVSASGPQHTVTVDLTPTVGATQRAVLLLNESGATTPASYLFTAPSRTADSASVTFDVTGAKAGTYLVRVQVDGAESVLATDQSGTFVGPQVAIP